MSYDIKTLREDRHAAEENFVAEATRRRRRSSRESLFLIIEIGSLCYFLPEALFLTLIQDCFCPLESDKKMQD